MSDKKRKRHAEGGERSSKKSAGTVVAGGDKIKISQIPRDYESGPIIAATPGLSIPPKITLKAFRDARTGSSSKSKTTELLLHSSEHPRIDYTAREHQDGGTEDFLRHYVGVYDPQKGELQLVEARKMSVRSTLRAEEQQVHEAHSAQRKSGTLSLRQELGMAFGTKKAKKAIASISENAIAPIKHVEGSAQADPLAAAVLESMAVSADNAPTKAAVQAEIDDAKPRPKHNPNAKKVEEVYEIGSIVGDNVMREVKVKPWVDAVEAGTPIDTPSRFVSRRLERIVEAEDIKKLKVLRYMLLLIKFFQALKVGGKVKKVPQREELRAKLEVDNSLVETIRRRFSDGVEMNKWHIDNLMTHLAALSLIVDDFESDTFDLREDLGVNPSQMAKYFGEIGAKIVPMTEAERNREGYTKAVALTHKVARLSLPLEFAKPSRPVATRRR